MEMKTDRTNPEVLRKMLDVLIEADMRMDYKTILGDVVEIEYFTKFHYGNIIKQEKIFNPELEIDIDQSFDDYLSLGVIKEVPQESKYGLDDPTEGVYFIVPNSKGKIKAPKKKDEDVPQAVKDNAEWWDG